MINDYTNVIKGQKVARRQQVYPMRGNTALQTRQMPALKRPSVPVYHQGIERVAPVVPPLQKQVVAPPAPSPYIEPAPVEERPETAQTPASEVYTELEARPSRILAVLPKIIIAVVVVGLLGFFSYHALLWQNNVYFVKPAPDEMLRQRLLDFAATGNADSTLRQTAIPPAELNVSGTFSWQYYTVRKGDNVSKIAASHAISMDAIIASNKMTNARSLREGDVLRIPNMDGIPYTIQNRDSYEKVSEKFGVPLDAILDANDVQTSEMIPGEQIFIPGARMPAEDLRRVLGEAFIVPVRGRLSSPFGWRKDPFTNVRTFHKGIDIVADVGTPIKAAMDGKISMVGFSTVLGKYIIITHNNTYQTMYAHLNSISVTRGARVLQGDIIGEVGNTGYSTGPHLHFVIYKNGREINPLEQLKL